MNVVIYDPMARLFMQPPLGLLVLLQDRLPSYKYMILLVVRTMSFNNHFNNVFTNVAAELLDITTVHIYDCILLHCCIILFI